MHITNQILQCPSDDRQYTTSVKYTIKSDIRAYLCVCMYCIILQFGSSVCINMFYNTSDVRNIMDGTQPCCVQELGRPVTGREEALIGHSLKSQFDTEYINNNGLNHFLI